MKIAVFLPNWIGDAVMATPALRAMRRHFAGSEIVGVCRPYVAEVLAGLEFTDRLLLWDPRGKDAEQRGSRFVRRLQQERFDLALLLPNSWRSAWAAWRSGAKRRIGFGRDGRGMLLTDAVAAKPRSEPNPVIDEYLRLAEHVGCHHLSREMELAVRPQDEQQLDWFWGWHPAHLRHRGIVCLNPGAAFGSAKHWPAESFGELARRIATEQGRTVLILCGPKERGLASRVAGYAAHRAVISLAGMAPTLGFTKAAIKHSDLLVTTDSGPRHFAPPFGVPVVTLFGPTHIAWSETFYAKAKHVQLKVDCGPCQQRVCPLRHHKCMRDLTVESVYLAACEMLERYRTAAKAS
jgi:heptosyltransferase-2